MIPPSLLLRLGTTADPPKSVVSKLPKYAKPLDCWTGTPYLGEIRFNTEDLKCYIWSENGWKEVK
jgi:hypothetical protein